MAAGKRKAELALADWQRKGPRRAWLKWAAVASVRAKQQDDARGRTFLPSRQNVAHFPIYWFREHGRTRAFARSQPLRKSENILAALKKR